MVRIITDSTSDITQEEGASLGVTVIPLTVQFGSESYRDGIDLSKKEFYEKLAVAEELPTTSQVPPGEFAALFERFVADGDEIVGLFISSEMSGTYQSATVAREQVGMRSACEGKIHVIDSRTTTFELASCPPGCPFRDEENAGEIRTNQRAYKKSPPDRRRRHAEVSENERAHINNDGFVGGLLALIRSLQSSTASGVHRKTAA